MKLAAVIPTRGDVELEPIVRHLQQFPEVVRIHIESSPNVYGRYVGIERLHEHPIIYTQDDDCITDLQPLIDAYEPGVIVNAMTPEHAAQYPGRVTLVGFGAIFDRVMVAALHGWEQDALFLREADRVFTALHPHKTVFPKIDILPCATAGNRLCRQPEHHASRKAIEQRIAERLGRER